MQETIERILTKFSNERTFTEVDNDASGDPLVKVIHNNERLIDLEKYLETPRCLTQHRVLYQLGSFVQYIENFKPSDKAEPKHGRASAFIELKEDGVKVTCVLDYHIDHANPTHCNHEAELSCNIDESFKIWSRHDNSWMSQKDMINLLKKHSSALDDNSFSELLAAIEDVKSDVKFQETQKSGQAGNSKAVFFKMINQFAFKFKPYFSMPFVYSTNADLYAQLDDNNRLQLKYSIRNQHKIHEQVAEDLRIELGHIEDLEVF